MAACEGSLGSTYRKRAKKAHAPDDLDRCVKNLELSLPHFLSAYRIYHVINRADMADHASRDAVEIEYWLQRAIAARVIENRG